MQKKTLLLTLLATAVITLTAAAIVKDYTVPQQTQVGEVQLAITIDGVVWDGTSTIDWGILSVGEHTKPILIENQGTVACTITFTTTGLEPDWSQTCDIEGTILQPTYSKTGAITLVIPDTVVPGVYSWDFIIIGTSTQEA